MTAKITAISHVIEVEILDDQYNQGVMWVNHSNATAFYDQNGKKISASQLKVGDVIEISYSGQVMLSYPAQISAIKIKVKESNN